MVDDVFVELLAGNPNVVNVTAHPRNAKRSKLLTDIGMIRMFRSGNYDLVVDLQGGPRGAWTSFFSGAKIRVGHYFKLRNSLLYNLRADTPSPVDHTWRVQFMIVR